MYTTVDPELLPSHVDYDEKRPDFLNQYVWKATSGWGTMSISFGGGVLCAL
jgi:hypothetical protein